jgi:hypothetical protein
MGILYLRGNLKRHINAKFDDEVGSLIVKPCIVETFRNIDKIVSTVLVFAQDYLREKHEQFHF